MKTASAKDKGRRLQKEIVEQIRLFFPELEEDDVQWRSMGAQGEDVILSPRARKMLPLAIEAKNQEKLNFWQAFEQAKSNNKNKYIPILVAKRNRTDALVTLNLLDFLWLMRTLYEEKESNSKSIEHI